MSDLFTILQDTMRHILGESKADIDKYIADLRKTLEAQLDEDTIVNVEF